MLRWLRQADLGERMVAGLIVTVVLLFAGPAAARAAVDAVHDAYAGPSQEELDARSRAEALIERWRALQEAAMFRPVADRELRAYGILPDGPGIRQRLDHLGAIRGQLDPESYFELALSASRLLPGGEVTGETWGSLMAFRRDGSDHSATDGYQQGGLVTFVPGVGGELMLARDVPDSTPFDD